MRVNTRSARLVFLAGMIVIVTLLHYSTPTQHYVFHNVYIRLYYAPIIVSAFWFGLRGAMGASLLVSVVYLPHVVIQWGHDALGNPGRYLEIVLFNVIGLVVGSLSEAERTHRQEMTRTATELADSYERLQKQTELLLEMEGQLMHSDRLAVLGELSATMAHEVRNPLASIKGAVEILKESGSNAQEKEEFLEILTKEVDRLNSVVDNYLSLARRDPPKGGLSDVRQVVRSVVALVGGRARKQGITVQVSDENEGESVQINPDLFRQVLLNLFLNAISAMPGGGVLGIRTEILDGQLKINVRDTGTGISEEEQTRVFEPFFTTKEGGSGLGLSIVKRIVEGLGGSIELRSRKGSGTEVALSIPIGGVT